MAGANTQTATENGGYIDTSTTGEDTRKAIMGAINKFTTGGFTSIILEFEFYITTIPTLASTMQMGLGVSRTITAQTGTETNTFGYGHYLDGATQEWHFVTWGNAVVQKTTATTPSTATWHRLRFEVTGTGTSIACYLDNTLIGTHTTQVPVTSTGLIMGWGIFNNGVNTAQRMRVRRMRCQLIP